MIHFPGRQVKVPKVRPPLPIRVPGPSDAPGGQLPDTG